MDFAIARRNMVDAQLRTNKVTDPDILAAMGELSRELFVPKSRRGIAYIDEDVRISDGRYLMEPMVLARLLQSAAIAGDDVALVVGGGTGYSGAVLARLCSAVFALDSEPDLVKHVNEIYSDLGIDTAVVVEGPLVEGWATQAPYDAILIDGAVASVPDSILSQLAEGGRLVAVVDNGSGPGHAMLFAKERGFISGRVLFDANIPQLPGFEPVEGFVF